jgi:hypothetical protein
MKFSVQHNVPVVFQPDDRFETLHPEQSNDDPWQDLLPRKFN